jgi:hypothetical protein
MRSVVFLCLLCAVGWLASGCETGEKFAAAAMYACSSCKDTVVWEYGTGPTKGIPTGKKIVKHTCSLCKKEWVAGVSPANACPVCNAKEKTCPECAGHGG